MDLMNWEILKTYAGAAAAVGVITQLTKDLPGIKKIPTQVYSYVLAVAVMCAAVAFTGNASAADFALTVINGAIVSLGANGGYEALKRIKDAANGEKTEGE